MPSINENGVWRIRKKKYFKKLFREPNLDIIVRLRRLQSPRHMQIMQDQRIKKMNPTFKGEDPRRKSQGRPRHKWKDDVREDANQLLRTKN